MDKGQNERNWFSVLIFEAMGTCLLVYFAITGDHNPLVTSLALFTCYLLFAVISKGHFNPAVSLGEWLGNLNKDWENKNLGKEVLDFMLRIIAQGIGGLAGAYLAYLVLARHRMDGLRTRLSSGPTMRRRRDRLAEIKMQNGGQMQRFRRKLCKGCRLPKTPVSAKW